MVITKTVMTGGGPVEVPVGASFFADEAIRGDYQARAIAQIEAETAGENRLAATNFADVVRDWTGNALNDRGAGITIPAKPIAPGTLVVRQVRSVATSDEPATGVYVWQEVGAPVGVCPDLPPVAPVHVEVPMPTTVMDVPPGDVMPIGYKTTAPDGSVWQKQRSPTPWGTATYYARISV